MTSTGNPPTDGMQQLLTRACSSVADSVGRGHVADYIPALAGIDPRRFGAAIFTRDGSHATFGDAGERFSIQSVSKVFTLAMALRAIGPALWERVGREPSGNPFNSIVQLEQERGIPRNPFINAGAIVVCDILLDFAGVEETKRRLLTLVRELAQDPTIGFDEQVADSEAETGFRNLALANFMKAFGNLRHPVDDVLDVYFHQCAIAMSTVQLARASLFLASDGQDPLTGSGYLTDDQARRICSVMLTCGHYDASGDFAFRVGLPGKSGVGGGIVAIVPGRASIAVWSPALNPSGSSHTGTLALEKIVMDARWHIL